MSSPITAPDNLAGKTLLLTGAGRGIGRALARHLAAEGAALVVNDLDADLLDTLVTEIAGEGGRALAAPGSVSDPAVADGLVATAVNHFGGLDGLVNNAGVHYESTPWKEDPARARQLVEVNVLGTLYCGMAALRYFIGQRRGSLVNVTSGAHLGVAGQATYAASKGAVASLTYAWALDARPYNVRVNAVAPLARTRMTDALAAYKPTGGNTASGVVVPEPDALAPLFGYLLADRSAAVTGQILRFNGRELSLISHPVIGAVRYGRDHWDIAAVEEVIAGAMKATLSPVGLGASHYQGPSGSP